MVHNPARKPQLSGNTWIDYLTNPISTFTFVLNVIMSGCYFLGPSMCSEWDADCTVISILKHII